MSLSTRSIANATAASRCRGAPYRFAPSQRRTRQLAATAANDIYSNRSAMGTRLLQLLDVDAADLPGQTAHVAALVQEVAASMHQSQDAMQLRIGMQMAASRYRAVAGSRQQGQASKAGSKGSGSSPASPWASILPPSARRIPPSSSAHISLAAPDTSPSGCNSSGTGTGTGTGGGSGNGSGSASLTGGSSSSSSSSRLTNMPDRTSQPQDGGCNSGSTSASTTDKPSGPTAPASGPSVETASTDGSTPTHASSMPLQRHKAVWSWHDVHHLVVVGLGSLGEYQQLIRSGKQTPQESVRASARLHQLALALTLPHILPGHQGPTVFCDPAFTDFDKHLLAHLGGIVMEESQVLAQLVSSSHPTRDQPSGAATAQHRQDAHTSSPLPAPTSAADSSTSYSSSNDKSTTMSSTTNRVSSTSSTSSQLGSTSTSQVAGSGTSRSSGPPSCTTVGMAARWAATAGPTLFYMPCCPRQLYDELLQQNLRAGTLADVAIMGNSFNSLTDSAVLFKALAAPQDAGATDLISHLSRSKALVEVPCPDFAAHGVAVGLHLFPAVVPQ